ncbi:MAG: hypothetical protein Fues2KO_52820 [Fuerstiella sp.]
MELIEEFVVSRRGPINSEQEYDAILEEVINASESIRADFMRTFQERHKDKLTLDDYRRLVDASILGGKTAEYGVFVSYSEKDSELADELVGMLRRRGVSCFLAKRTIDAGAYWLDEIRQAIHRSREMIMLITPESEKSAWVMIEAGAAWILGKRLTPCLRYVDIARLPEAVSMHQVRQMKTHDDMKSITSELAERLGRS